MRAFDGKVAVVTGATSGIGMAVARKFAALGADVILIGRNSDRGQKLEAELKDTGVSVKFCSCDVSDTQQVKELAENIGQKLGRVDILFNNAGVMLPSMEIERMPVETWRETFDINIHGMFYVTRALKPYLLESQGCIINNASIAGMQSYVIGRSYAYSASKAAVIQFSRQMAKNYGPEGVRVNCICPGIIDTPILGDRDRKMLAERIPLGRVGSPEDVANGVAFLASDAASYLTGVVLPIDGGAAI